MKIATAITTAVAGDEQPRELAGQVRAALGAAPVDLCLLFASAHFEDRLEELAQALHEQLPAEAVIGGELEYEHQPALVVWAAHLPGVQLTSFHLSAEDLQRLESATQVQEYLNLSADAQPYFVVLADPFTFNPTPALLTLLDRLHDAYPGRPVIGGLASAAEEPGQNRLVFDGQVLRHGLVGVALWGNVHVHAVVSQGCRPIGQHMVITRADRNVIYELGGKPPLQVVKQLLGAIAPRDRQLLQQRGLLVGYAANEYQKSFRRGDFVIRNPIGFDAGSGAMAVNDLIRTGQTVQFHVRDGRSASEDLDALVAPIRRRPTAGALLFSCNGRGTHLFNHRHHDARAVHDAGGHIPVAGFFCAGEIGPVGQRNFLHGHTASIGFFQPAEPASDA